jgi:uncharacterized membrane protein
MFLFAVFAAAAAPLAMTVGFFIWDNHWKGSAYALNLFKCNLAGLLFCVIALFIRTEGFRVLWEQPEAVFVPLAVSSLLGIIIGDSAWLTALQMIGARKVIFVDSLKPFLAAIFGTLLNNEPFTTRTGIALACCTVGIIMVCFENESRNGGDSTGKPDAGGVVEMTAAAKPQYTPLQSDALEDEEEALALGIIAESPGQGGFGTQIDPDAMDEAGGFGAWRLDQVVGYCCASMNVLFDVYGSLLTKQSESMCCVE